MEVKHTTSVVKNRLKSVGGHHDLDHTNEAV